jgi:chemosensory pili system protein ChpA (sensor histidine kinase/response regulator)
MDGFDLLRNVRADRRLAGLPVIMITSRTAQKHRDHAAELGADHYLGKPYAEDELLSLIAQHVPPALAAAACRAGLNPSGRRPGARPPVRCPAGSSSTLPN